MYEIMNYGNNRRIPIGPGEVAELPARCAFYTKDKSFFEKVKKAVHAFGIPYVEFGEVGGDSYEGMKVADLRKLAQENDISIESNDKKKDIIAKIKSEGI